MGCAYCGDKPTPLHMSLDRLDNSVGHIESNVVPCCFFCNYLQRDMPIEAWKNIVPTIIKLKQTGLFGGWSHPLAKLKMK